jgi:ubiquinone/menaquinone biosynthesis C-methylase UbiE
MIETNERFTWAAELLSINPSDHILEIGCGAGLLAEEIATRLISGKYLAVDKSAPMLAKAQKRNKEFIGKGIANFIQSDFSTCLLPANSFNKVVAFNVSFFRKNPARELEIIKNVLKPKGKLYVFYQEPFEITLEDAAPVKRTLLENNFTVVKVEIKKLVPTSAYCLIATPKSIE